MKHKSNKTSTQNITVSNLLNRLESWNCFTYAETKEYYETFRARDLPQKVKSEKEENLAVLPFQSSTLLIENYFQSQCHCSQNQCLKVHSQVWDKFWQLKAL